MPDAYHYLPNEFRNAPRPDHHMNPHFRHKKEVDEDGASYTRFHDCTTSDSCDSLLLHRVPSASLYLEDMIAQMPTTTSSQPQSIRSSSLETARRSSVTTLVDLGDWTTSHCHSRPPSLLPPAPGLVRLVSSETGKVECRLSSPTTPATECTALDTTAARDQLPNLSAQLQDVPFSAGSASALLARPVTPVPSLTTWHRSQSSFGFETSPCSTVCSPKDTQPNPPSDMSANTMSRTKKPTQEVIFGQHIRNISPPSQGPPSHCDDCHGLICLPVDPSRNSSYLPSRPVPTPDMTSAAPGLCQSSQDSAEVSYIEWDDEDKAASDSALHRLKKSFADLRAAERCITEASMKTQTEAAKAVQDSPSPVSTRRDFSNSKRSTASTVIAVEKRLIPTVNLRKKASTKNISALMRPLDVFGPSTPSSTGKRRRTNTMDSQRSQVLQKKKPKSNAVGKLVRRLLGAKREH